MKVQTRPKTRPLKVYVNSVECPADHLVTLITDGVRAYAVSGNHDEMPVLRNSTTMTVTCREDLRGNECGEEVRWDILSEAWCDAPAEIDLLMKYGQPVELHDDDPENPIVRDRG